MRKVNLNVPLYLPNALHHVLKIIKRQIVKKTTIATINLLGDRDIEWSWIASRLPNGSGKALDFGNGGSFLGLMVAMKGLSVDAVDQMQIDWPYMHPKLNFIQGDILKLDLPHDFYDVIINCSTIEHVGLAGRYDVSENLSNGDLSAMKRLLKLMKAGGIMLLTIPVGIDAVFSPMCRVYGTKRLPLLLDGFFIEEEVFWIKDSQNRWVITDRTKALEFKSSAGSCDAMKNCTALGCFVLKRLYRQT